MSSAFSPAPITSTRRSVRSPRKSAASFTATDDTDTLERDTSVSVRTRLPVASASRNSRFVTGPVTPSTSAISYERFTWPWTSASPTIIESSPLVTEKRCSTAALPRSE